VGRGLHRRCCAPSQNRSMAVRSHLMPPPLNPPAVDDASPWLGGLTPQQFMRRHWQKKPLLVRQAWDGLSAPIDRAGLFALASQDGVESRLVQRCAGEWSVRHGPFARRALPALKTPDWTLLVQGVDLHRDEAHRWLAPFRFVPQARLDDLMVSYASEGGGVGPHVDSYDVFLLQIHGCRRWRVGRVARPRLVDGLPLRILANFEPEQDWLLEPGDVLYVPPGWGHDGTAVGECMTASVGFRAPGRSQLAVDLLQRLLEVHELPAVDALYRDARQPATPQSGAIPSDLQQFAGQCLADWLGRPAALAAALHTALGEVLSEPKPGVWFEPAGGSAHDGAVRLDRRSRMLYDDHHLFINGEAYAVAGRDAMLLRRLADERRLSASDRSRLGADAGEALQDWLSQGWLVDADTVR
jgi:50S ribosomal protein L16 3-hydroxylase